MKILNFMHAKKHSGWGLLGTVKFRVTHASPRILRFITRSWDVYWRLFSTLYAGPVRNGSQIRRPMQLRSIRHHSTASRTSDNVHTVKLPDGTTMTIPLGIPTGARPEDPEKRFSNVALRRAGTASEAAGSILALASPQLK